MAPDVQPVLDPADMALLLSPEQIRNRGATNTNVSFLRKTQYMTSQNRSNDPFARNTARTQKSSNTAKSPVAGVSREDPSYIRRHIQKGFDIGYPSSANAGGANAEVRPLPINAAEREAWNNPVHPSDSKLKPVEFFSLVPDLPARSDLGSFISLKFDKPPLPARSNGKRDNRIDVALLRPADDKAAEREWQVRKTAYDSNPELYEDPGPCPYDWDMCLPKNEPDVTSRLRQALNSANPSRDDPSLYTNQEKQRFEFDRIRTLNDSTVRGEHQWRYLALSLFDPARVPSDTPSRLRDSDQGKAAYYYQIGQRTRLKADRTKTLAHYHRELGRVTQVAAPNPDSIDGMDVLVRDPNEDEEFLRAQVRGELDAKFNASEEMKEMRARDEQRKRERNSPEPDGEGGVEEKDADGDADVDMNVGVDSDGTPELNGVDKTGLMDVDMDDAEADLDAEGEEE